MEWLDDVLLNFATLGLIAFLIVSISQVATWQSQYDLDQAYEQLMETPTRNEWGQLPQSKERMCAATIKQWSEWCK